MGMSPENFLKLLGGMKVLYVEDEEMIRGAFQSGVGSFFKELYLAADGEEGLKQFNKHRPDMVITDINMPQMNGLEMIQKIQEVDQETTFVVVTAYDDVEYLLQSIEIGVENYLLKPVQMEHLKKILGKAALAIYNKRQAEKLAQIEMQSKINVASENAVSHLAEELMFPVALVREERFIYMNKAMAKIVHTCTLEDQGACTELGCLNSLVIQREDTVSDIHDIMPGEEEHKVAMELEGGVSFFQVRRVGFEHVIDEKGVELLVMFDITRDEKQRLMIDYQKNKLQNYNGLLEDLLIKKMFRSSTPKASDAVKNQESVSAETHPAEKVGIRPVITEAERELLNNYTPAVKTTAAEYVNELDEEVYREISILGEIERELNDTLSDYIDTSSITSIHKIASLMHEYGTSIRLMIEFEDLGNAILSLSTFLLELPESDASAKYNKLMLYLGSIINDLEEWRANIFVTQNAVDIHYLDNSLLSNCLQMQLEVGADAKIKDSDEDDLGLELF